MQRSQLTPVVWCWKSFQYSYFIMTVINAGSHEENKPECLLPDSWGRLLLLWSVRACPDFLSSDPPRGRSNSRTSAGDSYTLKRNSESAQRVIQGNSYKTERWKCDRCECLDDKCANYLRMETVSTTWTLFSCGTTGLQSSFLWAPQFILNTAVKISLILWLIRPEYIRKTRWRWE